MGKKSRRARTRAKHRASRRLARGIPAERSYPLEPKSAPKVAVPLAQSSSVPVQASRYQYVLPELRRIGIIASILFLVLIILAFVLG